MRIHLEIFKKSTNYYKFMKQELSNKIKNIFPDQLIHIPQLFKAYTNAFI